MIHPSTKKLIDKLGDMTAQRKISWAEGEDGAVVYDTEGYRVSLVGSPTEVILADALGKELDKADHGELSETIMEDGTTYAAYVQQLHKEAGRIARGAEHAIDAVLAGLDLDGDGVPDIDPQVAQDVMDAEAEVEAIAPPAEPEPQIEEVAAEADSPEAADDLSDDVTYDEGAAIASTEIDHHEGDPDVGQAVKDLAKQVNSGDTGPVRTEQPFSSNYGSATGLAVGTAAVAAGLGMNGSIDDASGQTLPEEPEPYQPTQIIPDGEAITNEALAEAAGAPLSEEEQNIANILDTVIGDDDMPSSEEAVTAPEPQIDTPDQPESPAADQEPAPSYLSQVSVFEAPIISTTSAAPALGVSGFGALPPTSTPAPEAPEVPQPSETPVQDAASDLADEAQDAAAGTADAMQEAASDVTEAVGDAVEGATDKVRGMLGGIGGAIGGVIGGAKDKAQGALEAVTDKVDGEEGETELGPDGKPKPRFNPWR